jgi:ATP-binding cassette subfamily B (MDR/TAP) protein 1
MTEKPIEIELMDFKENKEKEENINGFPSLPSNTKEKDNLNLKENSVSFFQLIYKFADKFDFFLIIFACIGSIAAGASMPLMSLLLGSAINSFGPDADVANLQENVNKIALNFIISGLGVFLGSFIMLFFWGLISKRLIQKINIAYFEVLLRQEQDYFDQGQKNEHLVTKINQEIKTIENGVIN